jgi:hypothetical protein
MEGKKGKKGKKGKREGKDKGRTRERIPPPPPPPVAAAIENIDTNQEKRPTKEKN